MKRFYVVLAAAVLASLPSRACAQDTATVRAGDRLRFSAPGAGFADRIAGTVVEVREGTLYFRLGATGDPGATPVAVPVSAIRGLERSEGRRSRVLHGVYGAVAGAGLGAGTGLLHHAIQQQPRFSKHPPPRSYVQQTTLVGTAAGVLVGALLPGERWRPVAVPAARVGVEWSAGPGLAVRVVF